MSAAALTVGLLPSPTATQGRQLSIVRDAETESLLRDYAAPIFQAAGLPRDQAEIVLINDKTFNAFVADARRMFMNIGVVLEAETPNEVIGVMAHETGHIAGNHLVRLREAIARAQIIGAIGTILGAGAVAAGAASGGIGQGGGAMIGLGGDMARRSLLSYQRGEEAAADRAALTYLERTGQSPRGLITTFERLAGQNMFAARYADPYAQSHPMPRERIRALEQAGRASPYYDARDSAGLQLRHDMVRAKILAYVSHPQAVARAYPRADTSLPAQYARAVVATRTARPREAVRAIDKLIAQQPNNAYFHELKGQALLEGGQPSAAISPFRQALALKPNEPQLQIWLGYALVAANEPGYLSEAETLLKAGLRRDPNSPLAYAQLAIAYGRMGRPAEADVAVAQQLMTAGNLQGAKRYATRALKSLPRGSPAWIQADDIVNFNPPRL